MNKNKKLLVTTILIHVVHLILFYAVCFVMHQNNFIISSLTEITSDNLMIQLFFHALPLLFFPITIILLSKSPIKQLGFNKNNLLVVIILFTIYVAAFILLCDYSLPRIFNATHLLINIGLGEELFFRGWSYNRLKTINVKYAVIISGLFFGLYHGVYYSIVENLSISQTLNAMVFGTNSGVSMLGGIVSGLLFILLLEWSGNLLVPILIHSLLNFSSMWGNLSWLAMVIVCITVTYLAVNRKYNEKSSLFPFQVVNE